MSDQFDAIDERLDGIDTIDEDCDDVTIHQVTSALGDIVRDLDRALDDIH